MHSTKYEPEFQASNPQCHWHALHTRHQHEKPIARILSDKGFEVFLPLYGAVHRWQDRNKQLWLPLFPSYVFVRGGLDQQLQIITTPGVLTIVGWAGRPAIIHQAEINAVLQMIDSSFQVEPYPYLGCGDRVRIKSGPLQGLEGVLVRKKTQFRLIVSMEMLGRSPQLKLMSPQLRD